MIGDVGQNRFEELDYTTVAAAAGANFGWDALEGVAPYTEENGDTPDPGGTVKPVFVYSHDRGGSCTIIGGYVVHDRSLPALCGRYVYADLCEGELRSLVPHLGRAGGDRKLGLTSTAPPRSAKTSPATSTSPRSKARSTGWCRSASREPPGPWRGTRRRRAPSETHSTPVEQLARAAPRARRPA